MDFGETESPLILSCSHTRARTSRASLMKCRSLSDADAHGRASGESEGRSSKAKLKSST